MYAMFYQCNALTSVDVSHFNTANVTAMNWMFQDCYNLTRLDLSSFNTAKVTSMTYMFEDCSSLTTIYTGSGWSTEAVTSSGGMFTGCTYLVGGMGTAYDESHTDVAYAHIDEGPSNPGYFTAAPVSTSGDVNGDGKLSIADVAALIDILLSQTTTDNADVNGDGNVSIADVAALIDLLLDNSDN